MPKARGTHKCTQCSYRSERPHDLKRHISRLHGEGQSDRESRPERTTPIRKCSVRLKGIVTPVPGNKGQQRALRKRGVTSYIVSSDSDSSESLPDISRGHLSGVNNGFVYQLKKKEPNVDEEEVESNSSKDVKDAKKCNGSLAHSSLNEEMPEDASPTVESVICTACCNQINPFEKNAFFGHPVLNVVFCKGCLELYNSCPWKEDEDGIEEDCRWCGQGGSLSVCDFCCMTFCRRCIMCNLGIVELDRTFSKEKWKCYRCEPAPLKELVAKCNALYLRCVVEMELKRHGTTSDDVSVNEPDAQDKPEEGEGKRIGKKYEEKDDVEKESESEENLHKRAKKVRKSAEVDPTSRDWPLSFDSSSGEESVADSDSCSGSKRESRNRKSKKIDTDDDLAASESDDVSYEKPKRKRVTRSKTASSSEESSVELKKPKKRGARREKSCPLLLIEISTSSEDEEDEDTSKKKKGKKATKKSRKKIDTDDDFVASESDDVSYEKPKRKRGGRGKGKKWRRINEDTRRRYNTASSSEESSVELKKPKKRRARKEELGTSSDADSGQETKSKKRGERGKGEKWRRINEVSDSESEEDIDDDLTSSESDNVSNETPRQKRAMRSETSSLKGKSTPKIPYFP
ncbi:transcriptional regulator ATRX-like [Strongylocentrotus purpuratus]|uniref:PHD-type domain-containing protein n=1 Tax=Strongylocentrotus purpuratus TaxID=7668 RepID=A0A7M7NJI2_STRPU|nr:transcriptional regulator ATRX-like [Strongylocentrotus purpuratus]XP_030836551.1 transcriptional regulator ATRX-like [Strongylocentrotus purpuratus]